MSVHKFAFCALILLPNAALAQGKPPRTIVEEVEAGMSCKQWTEPGQGPHMQCQYTVGPDLVFTIVGVGEAGASVYVDKSRGQEGAFYLSIAVSGDGCVRVKRHTIPLDNPTDWIAFVSPRTGKVYADYESCAESKSSR